MKYLLLIAVLAACGEGERAPRPRKVVSPYAARTAVDSAYRLGYLRGYTNGWTTGYLSRVCIRY